jgi:hypothetical protein
MHTGPDANQISSNLEEEVKNFRAKFRLNIGRLVKRAKENNVTDPAFQKRLNKHVKNFWDELHEIERDVFDQHVETPAIRDRLERLKGDVKTTFTQLIDEFTNA